ncbi:polymer biosynthesis protein, WecB/TagA/CpsF family [Clostridium cavendishii DSM 21758]|uniref:Polymer biosynthesis protein, WecB/TagA/CpsF family n=2 Tax=Clostridium TaxID=1485 RepID=A0A1M6QC20_9CLOT|nr:polymer biosynthesis protein, WecB/TagA/CpsF family [Clostridium cavendishii DSM 21758]
MKMNFLNTKIDNVTMEESLRIIDDFIHDGKYHYVVTPNVDHIVKLEEDNEFKLVYENADLILTDGMPLIWISKLKKKPIKEKVSGSDLFPNICKLAAEKGYKVFLLGAAEGVAKNAASKLMERYKGLKIVGTYSPKYGFEKSVDEIKRIISIVNEAKPDILAVGLGAPKQEKFIYTYENQLKVPVSLAIGAAIDFEAGNMKRSPRWMQKSGLEWFYRLMKEPKRMFKRYIIDDMKIIKILAKY